MDDETLAAIERRLEVLHRSLTDPAWGSFPFAQAVVHAVGDERRLLAENERLRCWLRGMVEATMRVEEPCGWCVEMQGWAVEALAGTPCDRAVLAEPAPDAP